MCKFCDKHNAKVIKAKMLIDRYNGKERVEDIDVYINRTDKGDTQLRLDEFCSFERRNGDSINRVSFHIRFCPLCGKKIGA